MNANREIAVYDGTRRRRGEEKPDRDGGDHCRVAGGDGGERGGALGPAGLGVLGAGFGANTVGASLLGAGIGIGGAIEISALGPT